MRENLEISGYLNANATAQLSGKDEIAGSSAEGLDLTQFRSVRHSPKRDKATASDIGPRPIMTDSFAWAPIGNLIGLEVQPQAKAGESEVYLDVDDRMHNPMGFVHGGVISLLADATMGIAFGRTLEDQSAFATVEMKISFIRPIKRGRLRGFARLIQRGLRIGFVECHITNQRGKLIATSTCTCTINRQ